MNTRVKNIFKWVGRIFLIILLILILLLALLRIPAIQTKIANIATNALSKQLETELSIGKVAINFVDNVCLKEVYAEDQLGDTLFYAEKLVVDIGLFKLISKTVDIKKVRLENSVINIHQQENEKFSFQFIVDAFTPEEPKPKKNKKPFEIDIGVVELINSDYSFDLLNAQNDLSFDELIVKTNSLDFEKLIFDVEKIAIENMRASSIWEERDSTKRAEKIDDINENRTQPFPLKSLPIVVSCQNLSINGDARYQVGEPEKYTDTFKPNFIHAQNIDIILNDIKVDSSKAEVAVKNIAANLNKQFQLQNLNANLLFSSDKINADNLELNTKESTIQLSASTDYDQFNNLLRLNGDTEVSLVVDDFQVQPSEVAYFVPELREVELLENYMEKNVELSGKIKGVLQNFDITQLHLNIAKTDLKVDGNVQNVIDVNNIVVDNLELQASTNITELRLLIGEKTIKKKYDHFGHIDLHTQLDGSTEELHIDYLNLDTDGQLYAKLSGTARNILDVNRLTYDIDITKIETGHSDIAAIVDSLPQMLTKLDTINYSGSLKGELTTYDLNGELATSLGAIQTDLYVDFNKSFTDASYEGEVSMDQFELGTLLSNDSIGSITMKATVDGSGLAIDSLNTIVDAHVDEVVYNQYAYHDIEIDGKFFKRQFTGAAAIEDENVVFDFEGMVDFNDSLPELDFTAALEKFDARALNLTNYPLQIELNISSDISGLSPGDISGELNITDVILKNEEDKWKTDSIVFLAENLPGLQRDIHLKSTFANLDIEGKYEIEHLPKILINFGDQFFPFSTFFGGDDVDDAVKEKVERQFSDEQMKAKLVLNELPEIASFFNIPLQELDSVYLEFNLDAPTKLINFEFFIPALNYGGIYADSVYAFAESKNEALSLNFQVDSINAYNTAYIPGLSVSGSFKDQKAEVTTIIENDTGGYSLNVTSLLDSYGDNIEMTFADPFILNNKKWTVDLARGFVFAAEENAIPEISLSHKNERLNLTTNEEGYEVDLENFGLNNIIELVELDSTFISGKMNGLVQVYTHEEHFAVSGDLRIDKINVNEMNIGDLHLEAEKRGNQASGLLTLSGNQNDVKVDAGYNIEDGKINGDLDINKFHLPTVAPLFDALVKDVEGYIDGHVDLSGTIDNLDLNGQLGFKNVSAHVNAIGSDYTLSQGSLDVSPGKLNPKFTFEDAEGRKANLTGQINHEYFRDFKFDLQLKTDKFTFLDSEQTEDELIFGKFVGRLNASIKGNIDLPVIRGSVEALEGTDITVQVLSKKAVASQESYVIFVDGSNYTFKDIDSIANARYELKAGFDLNMTASINDEAKARLIIDPLTGDNLELRGNAELTVKLPPYGDLDINGTYTITEGFYRFSFQRFLKRKFELTQGSQINFSGQPMNADLSLTAAYYTEASAYSLVQDQAETLSDQERREIKKKTDVEVLLNVDGKLSEPELSFDIQMPETSNSPVGSSVTRALNRIKQNESEMNKQVFSLLLFNSFTGSETSGNITSTGTSTAIRSVGNLINTQLNKLANRAEGFQIDFDLDQYEDQFSDSGDQITEIDLGLSQTLLDDRLVISVGSNIGLESGNQDGGALSNIAGDFVLTYKLTEDGKYAVRVFQKSDFDALNDANVWKTGAGFTYQTKFGNLRRNKKLRKENDEKE